MLALDALHGVAPSMYVVLGTRSVVGDPAAYYETRRQLQRAWRRRFPDAEFAWILEFTTGKGKNAGGERRPHWNVLVKGAGVDDVDQAHVLDAVRSVWVAREDAELQAQHVGSISSTGGLMKYLALHFLKHDQSPPADWRGHRFTKTRGYLWTETPAAREAAKASIRYKRELHKLRMAAKAEGVELDPEVAHAAALAAVAAMDELDWELVRRTELPATWGPDGRPATFSEEWFPVRGT